MENLPSEAKRYFRSRVISSLARGMRNSHTLRPDTWLRIRVLDGQMAVVDDHRHESAVLGAGRTTDIPPGVLHHAEALGDPLRFTIDLYRVGPRGFCEEYGTSS